MVSGFNHIKCFPQLKKYEEISATFEFECVNVSEIVANKKPIYLEAKFAAPGFDGEVTAIFSRTYNQNGCIYHSRFSEYLLALIPKESSFEIAVIFYG